MFCTYRVTETSGFQVLMQEHSPLTHPLNICTVCMVDIRPRSATSKTLFPMSLRLHLGRPWQHQQFSMHVALKATMMPQFASKE